MTPQEEKTGQGWRDIASAPRDGTVVLLSDGRSVVPGAFVPALHGEEWPWAFVDGFADAPQGCCNMEDDTRVQTNGFKEAGVTHWMPLPSAPSQDTEMGK